MNSFIFNGGHASEYYLYSCFRFLILIPLYYLITEELLLEILDSYLVTKILMVEDNIDTFQKFKVFDKRI
jgi:hypothetical protein